MILLAGGDQRRRQGLSEVGEARCHGEAMTQKMAQLVATIARGGEASGTGGSRDGRRQEEGGNRPGAAVRALAGGGRGGPSGTPLACVVGGDSGRRTKGEMGLGRARASCGGARGDKGVRRDRSTRVREPAGPRGAKDLAGLEDCGEVGRPRWPDRLVGLLSLSLIYYKQKITKKKKRRKEKLGIELGHEDNLTDSQKYEEFDKNGLTIFRGSKIHTRWI